MFAIVSPRAFSQSTRPAPSTPVAAQPSVEERVITRANPTKSGATPESSFDWQRLVVAMSVVLVLIFALRFLATKAFPGLVASKGSRAVRVLARSPLAPKQQLMLVQVGRRVLVVGDSAGELSSLSEITDPDEVASLLGQLESADAEAAPAKPFARFFGRARDDFERTTDVPADPRLNNNRLSDERAVDDQPDRGAAAATGELEATQSDINGLIDRMRSLTKTMRQ